MNFTGFFKAPEEPKDRKHLVYAAILLHGLGVLTAWNMFITAKDYFVEHKLKNAPEYSQYFLVYVGWASQIPNFLFNWINVFITIGGSLSTRVLWALMLEALIFVLTVILAMVDSSGWPMVFFWITMISVFLLNTLNAIYHNSIYGIAGRLPSKYIGAIVLGNNIVGTLIVLLSWATRGFKNIRTAAIYYFMAGTFVMLLCFDTLFALPLNRYYRYHVLSTRHQSRGEKQQVPYAIIFKQAATHLYNVFFSYFVSLAVFPAVLSDVKPIQNEFLGDNFVLITCFLTFNIMAMLGSLTASVWQFPRHRVLLLYTTCRVVFIPFFLLCNYQVPGRTLSVWFQSDWVYWIGSAVLSWTAGHSSTLALMYVTSPVAPEHAATAGMFGSAVLVTGIVTGITFGRVAPLLVTI